MGEGGISIIRVSGDQAIPVVNRLFKGRDLSKVASHTINYGHIVDPETGEELDEVMASVMKAPKTYTKEDVVEVNCHGGLLVTNQILELLLANGARMAEPGEFTKRAFLNGRLDLSQAEAVMDIIRAKTDKSKQVAVNQLDGSLSRLIRQFRQEILNVLAKVEVNIDYPEYDDAEVMTTKLMKDHATSLRQKLIKLLDTAKQGKVLRDGLATAIIGRPNVGKSSLLNALLHEDKAIVTNVAGTTRDVIEEYVNVKGVPLKLIDTAGIRKTDDQVEKIGVERSEKAINTADLVLLLIDGSAPLTAEDHELITATQGKQRIVLVNKTDLPQKIDMDLLKSYLDGDELITTSIITNQGMDQLATTISHLFFNEGIESSQNQVMVTNARQIALLKKAKAALDDVLTGIDDGMPVDLVQIDLRRSWDLLGEITGNSYQDELIDQLFSQFCLGK
ncbi:tRNA uridine-5-carboxymethylaminomethyl(34) synthesis GTPase MnmE [Limosilactobacillus difficilis]|uniref:tRNA uridine-5-carboxymethylaminomethyl(34) synthesis GTPase MnmE n=1 Tax=Limosilactobacillus difficilis TaxID=2991838 RepID=UPI0038CC16C7